MRFLQVEIFNLEFFNSDTSSRFMVPIDPGSQHFIFLDSNPLQRYCQFSEENFKVPRSIAISATDWNQEMFLTSLESARMTC
jgi:hypothetical protein